MRLPASLLSVTLGLVLAGCATHRAAEMANSLPTPASAPTITTTAPAADASDPAPHDLLNAVAWQQTSMEARLLSEQAYRDATDHLDVALRDRNWDALPTTERANRARGLPPAVIVDVDETVLDNSSYQARLIRDRHDYDDATWNDWVHEEAAQAIPGALAFTRAAAAKGITVFYLSNRTAEQSTPTVVNLRQLGFPVARPDVFLGLGTQVTGCEQVGTDKTCRRQLIGRKYRVLLQIGDQIGDFATIPTNTIAGRMAAMQPYSGWIGERWFLLPNPTYGSWAPALFNNDYKQSPQARRREMIDALRTQ